jgi:hypothetical protein
MRSNGSYHVRLAVLVLCCAVVRPQWWRGRVGFVAAIPDEDPNRLNTKPERFTENSERCRFGLLECWALIENGVARWSHQTVSENCLGPGERFSAATPHLTALRTRVRRSGTLTYVHTPAAPERSRTHGLPPSVAFRANPAESFRLRR